MEANGRVDLSVCQLEDRCHHRNGGSAPFRGRTPEDYDDYETHPYLVGAYSYRKDGTWSSVYGAERPLDIVRVTRIVDGQEVQITPAIEKRYQNAGPECDLGRYRTGEVPQVGDRLRAHGFHLHEPEKAGERVYECVVTKLKADSDDQSIYVYSNECNGEYAARFDMISRATPAVPPEPGVESRLKCPGQVRCGLGGGWFSPSPSSGGGWCSTCGCAKSVHEPAPANGSVLCGNGDSAPEVEKFKALAKRHSDRIEELVAMLERVEKPINMQDVRLVAGEGKLTPHDVLRAVNVIVSQRIEGKTAPETDIGQTLISRLKDFTAAVESGDLSKFRITRVQKSADGMQVIREQIEPGELFIEPASEEHDER